MAPNTENWQSYLHILWSHFAFVSLYDAETKVSYSGSYQEIIKKLSSSYSSSGNVKQTRLFSPCVSIFLMLISFPREVCFKKQTLSMCMFLFPAFPPEEEHACMQDERMSQLFKKV